MTTRFRTGNLAFVKSLVFAHPRQSAVASACLTLAGLAEGIGLATLLPLLSFFLVSGTGKQGGALGDFVRNAFQSVGLEPKLVTLLVLIVTLMSLKAILVLTAMRQAGNTVASVETELRVSLIQALMKAKWEYFITKRHGTLANAVTVETELSAVGYWFVCRITAYSLQILVYAAVSALVSWQVTLAAMMIGGASVAMLGRFVVLSRRTGRRQIELLKSLSSQLLEVISSIKPLKAMGCEARLVPILQSEAWELGRAREQQIANQEKRTAVHEPMLVLIVACGLYSAVEIWHAEIGAVMMLALLFWRILSRVGEIHSDWLELARLESAFQSLKATIDAAEAASEGAGGGKEPLLEHGVALRDVTFSYGDRTTLERVSLEIPVGSFVALVGPSGAGKTTIGDLVVGLIRPTSGDVYVDGTPLSMLNQQAWRGLIGYTPQEAFLAHGPLYFNIALGDPAITRADAEEALIVAGAGDLVSGLPEGMDTVVGDRGAKLSGGQRLRVAIARALVRKPKLLILDEVTAALDARTEAEVCENLRSLKGKVTILAISHQPALVDAADKVYRVENRRVSVVSPTSVKNEQSDC